MEGPVVMLLRNGGSNCHLVYVMDGTVVMFNVMVGTSVVILIL